MPREALNFAYERQRHGGFVGRAALLAQLDQQLIEEPTERWVVVTGGPGMGKSAVLAAWLARREAAGDMVPHHFIRRGWANWDDPEAMVGSLVAQIESRVPEAREPEADTRLAPAARLAAALVRVSERALVPRGERLVLLIDGLDEYDPRPESLAGDPLGAFLPYALPRGVSVLCASRPRHPYVDSLATRGVLVQIDLDDAQSFAADNAATVHAFWEQAACELGLDAPFIAQAVERAGGNLEHAAMLHRQLAGLPREQRHVENIPRGLGALLASAWGRIATDPAVVDGLGALCAAREPLTLDELGRVARWTGAAPRQVFVRGAREWLIETRRTSGASEYRLHHDSIRGHVANAIGTDALAGHHLGLAQKLATWPAPAEASGRRYALHHALLHRAEAGAWADAWHVAADVAFLEAKRREVGVDDAEADVARTAARCRASGDETHGERFGDLARALGRESHWLRAAPEAIAALVWNRLRRYGWTVSDLDAQLRVPAAVDFLRVRHAATRESPALVRNLAGHTEGVTACTVMPDGRHAVSASEDHTLKVWELGSGRAVATLAGHTGVVTACAVTPDGWHVVSASRDHTLKVWKLGSGCAVATLAGHTKEVTGCAVVPDGRYVVSASEDHTLKVWELGSGRAVATLAGHTDVVTACAVTPDGRHVVSASRDHTLKVWELGSGRAVAMFEGHNDVVTACAVTPDGRHVVSASHDRTLKVWELGSGRAVTTLEGHTDMVTACTVTPDGWHVVSASWDATLKVWELGSGRGVATLAGHAAHLTACAVTPNGRHVVSASWDATLKVWELGSRRTVAMLEGHNDVVTACAVTPDGRHAVSASWDATLKVWELGSGRAVATLEGHNDGVTACTVTSDGRYVVSASWDLLKVWELGSGRAVATLEGDTYVVTACKVTPDGRRVILASDDHTLKVWDLGRGREVATLEGHNDGVTACAVMSDGRHLLSASDDHTLKVWDLGSGCAVATLEGHTSGVTACAVMPDGRYMVSASRDETLKVWELESGRAVATLAGHTRAVRACAVTPDGRHVISASDDQTLKVWDLATYTCRITHRGDAGYLAVAVSATTVIAGDAAGTFWLLDLPRSVASSIDAYPPAPEPPMPHTTSPASGPVPAANPSPNVDIGIVTTRDDEFRAVLAVFPDKLGNLQGARRPYTLRQADVGDGARYRIAVLRLTEQGQGEAQDAVRDLIEDLAPRLVLVVGIAGGRPSDDVKLGDVVVSTRIHDFTIEAREAGQATTYDVTGGPIDKVLAALVANLAAREDELGDWTTALPPQPTVSWTKKGQLYGPPDWQRELREKLEHHHDPQAMPRAPRYAAGPIASSDRLVKDPDLVSAWLQDARSLLAIEMESGGVYRAARERCPMLAIRGISDIVGLKRADAWTKYACASAAAFTRAFLRTRPIELGSEAASRSSTEAARRAANPSTPPQARDVSPSPASPSPHVPRSPMTANTILFMAANPTGTDARALAEQARAIQAELERAGHRDRFTFETRWAAQPLDLLRDMVKLKPTVVHFCGGRLAGNGGAAPAAGVYFQGADGHAQVVSNKTLTQTFASVGSVKLVVLDACYSDDHADSIATHVDCVVGMAGGTVDPAATSFSIGLYGGLGEGESVEAAFKQGCAAIGMTNAGDSDQPRLRVRPGVDASRLVLADPR